MQLSAPIYRLKRQAHQMTRDTGQRLHLSLDAVAQAEGYRSWDHLSASQHTDPIAKILTALPEGSLCLLAARPGQGKTLLALELTLAAAKSEAATFYTLDYSEAQIAERLNALGAVPVPQHFQADHSDEISADYIAQHARPGFVAVDYLQLLDQRRDLPPLEAQCRVLRNFARASGSRIVLISQVHRSFDGSTAAIPGPRDIRLPNPIDLGVFDQRIFLHEGRIEMSAE